MSSVPSDPQAVVSPQLGRSERLLWSGRPRQGIVLRPADGFLIPFSLLWAGFAFFWEYSVLKQGGPWFFALWGIPFVLVGLYIVLGRFGVDARRRERTAYGLTNERVVIVSGMLSQQVKSLSLRTLTDVTLDQRGDGTGTITFGASNSLAWWYQGLAWPGMPQSTPSFELIPRAKEVYDLIQGAQRGAG